MKIIHFQETLNTKLISLFFFFNDTATTEIYTTEDTLSLHDALPISKRNSACLRDTIGHCSCEKRSEEHTSELQSPSVISYAVFCLKKKKKNSTNDEWEYHRESKMNCRNEVVL